MAKTKTKDGPAFFSADDPALRIEETERADEPQADATSPAALAPVEADPAVAAPRRIRWGALFVSALAALVGIGASLAIYALIEDLFTRSDWLGWTATAIAVLAAVALFAMIVREIAGLLRIGRITRTRLIAERAHRNRDMDEARHVSGRLKAMYAARRDLEWGYKSFLEHRGDIYDADDLLRFAERELMKGLDAKAADEISRTARRVAVVTAVSPAALIDVGFVLYANLRLMRRLAALYGGRPGFLGLLKLGRNVLAHLALTGGIAIGDSLIQQVLGHGLAARLSARLGEGVLNGMFTARIGLAAIAVCRPLPFLALTPPSLKRVMGGVATLGRDS